MKSPLPNDELLSAYLDGEATDQEREVVERALRESSQVRASLEGLRRLQADLRALPPRRLEPDFCDQVLRQAQRTMLLGDSPDTGAEPQARGSDAIAAGAGPLDSRPSPARPDNLAWRAGWQPRDDQARDDQARHG